jgi:hypothetical protein
MDGDEVRRARPPLQTYEQRLAQETTRGDDGQEVRLVGDENVFVLMKHPLLERDVSFRFGLAIVEDARARAVRARRRQPQTLLVNHLALPHPRGPSLRAHRRVTLRQKVEDGLPLARGQRLPARGNAFDDGQRRPQRAPFHCPAAGRATCAS